MISDCDIVFLVFSCASVVGLITPVIGGGKMVVLLKILLVIISLALIAVVLLQPGKSAGLSGAIAGGAEQMIGTKAKGYEKVLERVTKFVAIAFLLLTFIVAYLVK